MVSSSFKFFAPVFSKSNSKSGNLYPWLPLNGPSSPNAAKNYSTIHNNLAAAARHVTTIEIEKNNPSTQNL